MKKKKKREKLQMTIECNLCSKHLMLYFVLLSFWILLFLIEKSSICLEYWNTFVNLILISEIEQYLEGSQV